MTNPLSMTINDPKMIMKSLIPLFLYFLLIQLLFKRSKIRLPPGPPKLPFIGNMNQLVGPSPHRVLRDLALKYGPLMHLKLGFISTIIVSSAEAATEIMKTHDLIFSNRPKLVAPKILGYNYTDIAFGPYGAYWRQLRKICILELLSNKRVNSFRVVREEETRKLVRSIASTCPEPVTLVEKLFSSNLDIITRITFGKKLDDQRRFRVAMKEGTSLASGFQIGDFFPSLAFVDLFTGLKKRLEKTFYELDSFLSKAVEEHVERRKISKPEEEDLVDVLLQIKDHGGLEVPLTVDNIKSVILDLFVGGTENSSNSIEWAMTELIKNPKTMEKAQAEVREACNGKPTIEESDLPKLKYLKMVVKETMRFHPPLPFLLPRESMEKCTINGYEIPAKTRTIINYWAISRDPNSWKNPEKFEPERFEDGLVDFKGQNFEFIPFGAGRRICPGISFGTANLELGLAALLYHFDWQLADGMKPEDLDVNETYGLTMYRTSSLRLVPTVRFPVPT
ncbi:Premnaspirodiene oxygenase [Actinidia chinensis var. chinensis]|uniref:Premnaspirodiene oxygenase n=1 Tax=Actinidia chinensis var. chinensis TaxID=1590841 RepID=A0A2R6Q9T4_ACTCC|nr:Premnaspirodiene oxygenase [Actinidia chinensis var. chinensis]